MVTRGLERDKVACDKSVIGQERTPLGARMVGALAMALEASSALAMASSALWDDGVGWQWQVACCWPEACGGMETFWPLAWRLRRTARRDGTWSESDGEELGYGDRLMGALVEGSHL